ncbi:MAG: hypothetical protein WCX31_12175 [Salinivirgaceae bacterium]|jgi:hypothetical protein
MTTITINERTAKGKSLLQFLSKFEGENFIQFENDPASLGKVINKTVKKRGGRTEKQNKELNETTKKAIFESEKPNLKRFKTVKSLMDDLRR